MQKEEITQRQEEDTRWLTEKQVHNLTSLSLSTLRSHRFYRKGIPYSKIGRSVRYSLEDVLKFMDSHKVAFFR